MPWNSRGAQAHVLVPARDQDTRPEDRWRAVAISPLGRLARRGDAGPLPVQHARLVLVLCAPIFQKDCVFDRHVVTAEDTLEHLLHEMFENNRLQGWADCAWNFGRL